MGRYGATVRAHHGVACSGVRATLWHLPSTSCDQVGHGRSPPWMAATQPGHHCIRQARQGRPLLASAVVGGCRAGVLLPTGDTFAIAESHIKGAAHRLIPRHVITQSSGKQRVIDNGDTGGQSDRSSDANKLTLCSALRPAQHIALAMSNWTELEVAAFREGDSWETGQEDLPSA